MNERKPCEYCGVDLPKGVDKRTRQTRSHHFSVCEKRIDKERRAHEIAKANGITTAPCDALDCGDAGHDQGRCGNAQCCRPAAPVTQPGWCPGCTPDECAGCGVVTPAAIAAARAALAAAPVAHVTPALALAEKVALIGPASRQDDLYPAIERFYAAATAAPVARTDGMPASAAERLLRRLLAARVSMPGAYYDDGEAHGTEHGIQIDFMREPAVDLAVKLQLLNEARAKCAAPAPVAQFNREKLHRAMRNLGFTTNGQTEDLIDLFEEHLKGTK